MTSASLTASTACTVASPGCPGPTPTSLTLLIAPPCPTPPGTQGERLELSADHVVGQRGKRRRGVAGTDCFELFACRIGVSSRFFERALRTMAAAAGLDSAARLLLVQTPAVFDLDG